MVKNRPRALLELSSREAEEAVLLAGLDGRCR
jgi:hypothetical protein